MEGSSFGKLVYTDEHGFRVPKGGLPEDERKSEAILILGDSVGFGPAVEEGDTFAGLLRTRFPARRIYNSSVIGYSTPDYRNVVDAFLPRHPEVKAVVLVYCLNDVSAASAQNIDRYLKEQKQNAPKKNLTETLRSFTLLSDANDFLRSRSKLYLFLRHRLLGTQMRDWKGWCSLYSERPRRRRRAVGARHRRDRRRPEGAGHPVRGRTLSVRVSAEEPGRSGDADPAAKTRWASLAEAGVDYIDPRPVLRRARRPSTDYFLAYDPMHFPRWAIA